MFLGDELTEIFEAIESGADYQNKSKLQMEIGVTVLPHFPKDTTDRNRTSSLAFTGNKFEFRMLGSMISIAGANFILNTAVAEVLRQFAEHLENSKDFKNDLAALIKKTFREHKRIIFNGNNYSNEWKTEAERRGLSNLKTTVDALPVYVAPKTIELFASHNVFIESELYSRYEIFMEGYCKTIHIEALTMVDMVKGRIIPACIDYQNDLVKLRERKHRLPLDHKLGACDYSLEYYLLHTISGLSTELLEKLTNLENYILESAGKQDVILRTVFYRDKIISAMSELRLIVDKLEALVARKHWPFPTYAELLYSVI
jgi:glutamine synthetase